MKQTYYTISLVLSLVIFEAYAGDFSIGPRIITQKRILSQQQLLLYIGLNRGSVDIFFHSLAYGLTENVGLQLTVPIFLGNKLDGESHTGLGNCLLFGEWQFYKQPSNLGVITVGVRAPTQTVKKFSGEISHTAGYIFDCAGIHSSEYWYAQARGLILITPEYHGLKPGSAFFYTLEAGPKINFRKTALFSLIALRGIHANNGALYGHEVRNGGDVIFLGPQFGLKRNKITLAGAAGWPIMQLIPDALPHFEWFGAVLFQVDF